MGEHDFGAHVQRHVLMAAAAVLVVYRRQCVLAPLADDAIVQFSGGGRQHGLVLFQLGFQPHEVPLDQGFVSLDFAADLLDFLADLGHVHFCLGNLFLELLCLFPSFEDLVVQQIQAAEHPAPRMAMRQITQLIHETVVLVREELMGRGVFLEENYADRVPELLLDGPRLKQALLNILHDSLESVQDGDTIRIEVLREGDRVLLEIANTGRPAAGEIIDKLFVPFQTSGPAGIGLGLSVAQQIIREHGGEVSVRSEGEWGAIFTISLPIRANQERRKLQDRRIARDRRKPKKGRGKDAA